MSDDNKKPTVVNLELPPDELAAAVELYKRQLPSLREYQKLSAQLHRVKYLALVKEGFTKEQALILCNSL